MENMKVNVRVNCKGQICPVPVLKVKKALDGMKPGEVLEMVATEPGVKADIKKFVKRMGHELLESRREGSFLYFYIRK
jgi:TusA-related sulfurtransferase